MGTRRSGGEAEGTSRILAVGRSGASVDRLVPWCAVGWPACGVRVFSLSRGQRKPVEISFNGTKDEVARKVSAIRIIDFG